MQTHPSSLPSRAAKCILGALAAAALLAGCSNGSASQYAPHGNAAAGATRFLHDGHVLSTSVLSPEALAKFRPGGKPGFAARALQPATRGSYGIFVSDAYANQIYVFSYPRVKYLGTLPQPPEGFSEPQGLCSDGSGNLFVANTSNSTIDEYRDLKFVQALSDPKEYPVGCAVDPKSNTLAASNIISTSGGQGGISLYANETGTAQQLIDPNMYEVYFLGYYADTGRLFYSGDDTNFYPALSSYSNGKFKIVPLKGATLGFAGTVTYSTATRSLAVGDQDTFYGPTFYHVKSNGKVTGSTVLACESGYCDVVQASLKGHRLFALGGEGIGVFDYPAGGNPIKTILCSFEQPIGTAFALLRIK